MAITLETLKKAIKKNKGRSQALAWLADMERASGDYDAALKIVDEALAASPSDIPAMLVRAQILAGKQDFAGSVMEYKKVLSKDPFCLSAHKRLGEAYDKLGKEFERNACFRRVHDMDPLDPFWKEEYDVLPEEQDSDLMVPPMDDSSFTMDMDADSENAVTEEDNIFANLAASLPNADEDDSSSMDALRNSLNTATGEFSADGVVQDPHFDENVLSTSEVSSAITGILGGDDDLDSTEFGANESDVSVSPFSQVNIANAIPKPENTELSLKNSEPVEVESQPTNVDDAFSSLLGDDELPDEKSVESLSIDDSVSEPAPTELVGESDKETNIDDAFSSLLGDDEFPDEKPAENMSLAEPATEDFSGGLFEKSADAEFSLDESAPEPSSTETVENEDKETNIDDAFSSIFGNDDLPEEKVSEAPTPSSGLAESTPSSETLSAIDSTASATEVGQDADLNLDEPAEESFGGLFEKSADAEFSLDGNSDVQSTDSENVVAESAVEKAPEFVPSESAENIAPAEGLVPTSHMDFSDDDSADSEKLDVSEADNSASESGVSESIDGAFDALFGDDEAAESPAEESAVAQAPLQAEDFTLNNDSLELPTEATNGTSVPGESSKEDDLAKEMGGAFASMFGDDDDLSLPDEKQDASASSANSLTGSATGVEKNVEGLAEVSLSQEATGAQIEEGSIKENVDESFESIFGADDDLPEEKTVDAAGTENVAHANEPATESAPMGKDSKTASVEQSTAQTSIESATDDDDVPSAELDSIDSEVSNAFKGLFDEDDALPETDVSSNKGVDYLMSGDSDDELSASLVNNSGAPLSRGATDLDDSLNTRTLADIYMEQGVYNKALEIYEDLAKKNPDNGEIKSRLHEIEKLYHEKFGDSQNG